MLKALIFLEFSFVFFFEVKFIYSEMVMLGFGLFSVNLVFIDI